MITKSTILVFSLSMISSVYAGEVDTTNPDIIAEGGRLYDKWWEEYDLEKPTSTHPAYPKAGKLKGADTWRCKECHGWDYKGAAGAYSKGSHYSGIKGIQSLSNQGSEVILKILKNETHQFDKVMLDYGLLRLASFVSAGQVDISNYLEGSTTKVKANPAAGRSIYTKSCKECHGSEGKKRNFKDDNNPEYVGTVANKNPWEAMHKLRNGHPGAFVMGDPMPHMIGELTLQEQLDLLAYTQTLPQK